MLIFAASVFSMMVMFHLLDDTIGCEFHHSRKFRLNHPRSFASGLHSDGHKPHQALLKSRLALNRELVSSSHLSESFCGFFSVLGLERCSGSRASAQATRWFQNWFHDGYCSAAAPPPSSPFALRLTGLAPV